MREIDVDEREDDCGQDSDQAPTDEPLPVGLTHVSNQRRDPD